MKPKPKPKPKPFCKSCRRNDHSRRSSHKCPNNIAEQKKRFVSTEGEGRTFVVKGGLNKFCPDPNIRARIKLDVAEVSALSIEASLYVFWYYNKRLHNDIDDFPTTFTPNHLLDFYYHLQDKKQKGERVARDPEYFRLRQGNKVYDGTLRNYLIQSAAQQHLTAMKNCVCVHLKERIVRHLSIKHQGWSTNKPFQWRQMVDEELFNDGRRRNEVLSPEITGFLNEFGLPNHRPFHKFETNWWAFVPFSFKLGKWFAENNCASFALFPVFKSGPKHVRYNGSALYELLRAVFGAQLGVSRDELLAESPKYWWRHFRLNKAMYGRLNADTNMVEPNHGRVCFGMAMTTDGLDCSIQMERFGEEQQPQPPAKRRKVVLEPQQIPTGDYARYLGIDPGVVNIIGACAFDVEERAETNLVIKTETFKNMWCRERVRRLKRQRLCEGLERQMLQYRKLHDSMTAKCSVTFEQNVEYIIYRLAYFNACQFAYGDRKYIRLNRDGKIDRRRAVDQLVERVLHRTGRTLVCFGDGGGGLQQGVSYGGNRLPAIKKLQEAFLRRTDKCDVRTVDEFRTSRSCSKCFSLMKMPPKHKTKRTGRRRHQHRNVSCAKCHLTWVRDINAARNIAMVAKGVINYRTGVVSRVNAFPEPLTIQPQFVLLPTFLPSATYKV